MKYYIVGISHFLNLFFEYFDFMVKSNYVLIIIFFTIAGICIFATIKNNLWSIMKTCIGMFKFPLFVIGLVLNIIQFCIIYNLNEDTSYFSIFVGVIEFVLILKDSMQVATLTTNREKIISTKVIKSMFIAIGIIIFIKLLYWGENYQFNWDEIKHYFIWMSIAFSIQVFSYTITSILNVYEQISVRKNIKSANYSKSSLIIDFIKILFKYKNDIRGMVIFQHYIIKYGIKSKDEKAELFKMINAFYLLAPKNVTTYTMGFYYDYMDWYLKARNDLQNIIIEDLGEYITK